MAGSSPLKIVKDNSALWPGRIFLSKERSVEKGVLDFKTKASFSPQID